MRCRLCRLCTRTKVDGGGLVKMTDGMMEAAASCSPASLLRLRLLVGQQRLRAE